MGMGWLVEFSETCRSISQYIIEISHGSSEKMSYNRNLSEKELDMLFANQEVIGATEQKVTGIVSVEHEHHRVNTASRTHQRGEQ